MEQDEAPSPSEEGVRAFMQRVNSFLEAHVAAKSDLYELDFHTARPYKNPVRFLWDHVPGSPRPSVSTVDTLTTLEEDFAEIPTFDSAVGEEGHVSLPADHCDVQINARQ